MFDNIEIDTAKLFPQTRLKIKYIFFFDLVNMYDIVP